MLGLGNTNTTGSSEKHFHPNDISDCVLALLAGDIVTPSTAGTVISWGDQSGAYAAPIFAYQSEAGKRPAYYDSYITFDGSNDRLALTELNLSTKKEITLDVSDNGFTIIVICTSDDWNGSAQALLGDPDDSENYFRMKNGADKFEYKASDGDNLVFNLDDPTALTDNTYYSIMLICASDGTLTLYINNTAQSDTETDTDDFKFEQIGMRDASGNPLDGNLKHVVVYDKALDSDERALINTWSQQYIG